MPVRKIPMNYLVVTGKSLGRGRVVQYEGTLEPELHLLLRFDPVVKDYEEQPVTIKYVNLKGRKTHYTPDLLVHFRDSRLPELIEVKPSSYLEEHAAELFPKFEAARAYARTQGWTFKLMTEKEIRIPRLENLKFLSVYADIYTEATTVTQILTTVSKQPISVKDLLSTLCKNVDQQDMVVPMIWHLVLGGKLNANLSVPISMTTVLSKGG